MSGNTLGRIFRITTAGESHGPGYVVIVDGCPPGLMLSEADIQPDLDRRKPGSSKFTTQRRESDTVKILSGVFEGKTTGTSIAMLIENEEQRSRDYEAIKDLFRPGMVILRIIINTVFGIIVVVEERRPVKPCCG